MTSKTERNSLSCHNSKIFVAFTKAQSLGDIGISKGGGWVGVVVKTVNVQLLVSDSRFATGTPTVYQELAQGGAQALPDSLLSC